MLKDSGVMLGSVGGDFGTNPPIMQNPSTIYCKQLAQSPMPGVFWCIQTLRTNLGCGSLGKKKMRELIYLIN